MKDKNSTIIKKTILFVSMIILILIFFRPNNNNPSFLITGDFIKENKNAENIQIIEIPSIVEGRCGEWKTFIINVKNNNNLPAHPKIKISAPPDLKFMYPKQYIIPPKSKLDMVFLVNFYCNDIEKEMPVNFTISDASKTIPFKSLKW